MSMREAIRQVRDAAQTLNARGPKPFPVVVQGLEAVIVGGVLGVERKDWIVPGQRERVGAVLRGCPVERLADASAGARPYRVAPVSQDPANRLLHAVGLSLAERDRATLCFVGQGSASCGAFHEALNLAALHRVNLIIVAHTWNLDEPGAPLARQLAGTLASKALAFGVHATTVDGGLVTAVLSAVAEARAHGGPHLIEARLHRGDDPLRRAEEELTEHEPSAVAQTG